MSLLELDKKGRVTVPKEYRREHYAATALKLDGSITSFERACDDVKGLKRIDPA